jgi:prepilin signal peptidase PulO-like enzyme (type II secretory pathway)
VPVISWLFLKGACRYCKRSISPQYPIIEVFTAFLFVLSYAYWPLKFDVSGILGLTVWLIVLIGLVALLIYDVRWMLLPNKILIPFTLLAFTHLLVQVAILGKPITDIWMTFLAILISSGIFYLLFQISSGKWIGGGDVKLGVLLGILVGTPINAFLVLFISSLLGTMYAFPLALTHKLNKNYKIPYGPFLIMATIIVKLFSAAIVAWYQRTLLYSF